MNLSAVIIKYVVDLLDSNKRRHKIRRKINEDKSTLAAAIKDFNEQSVHQLPWMNCSQLIISNGHGNALTLVINFKKIFSVFDKHCLMLIQSSSVFKRW